MLTNQHNFAIGIPTINQWELLKPFIELYLQIFPQTDICIVDNGHQDIHIKHHNLHVIKNPKPKSVAASWNQLCRFIFLSHKNALILNDDVCLNAPETMITALLKNYEKVQFFLSAAAGWQSFILPKQTFHQVGQFDENFKGAYFEDNDYWYRLTLLQADILRPNLLNPEIFGESMSIKKDPSLNKHLHDNLMYYIKKWGNGPGGEKFIKPFDGK